MIETGQMVDEALELLAIAHLGRAGNPAQSVDRYTDKVLELIRQNPHLPRLRPCTTCREITAMVGLPFWCLRVALELGREAQQRTGMSI